MSKILKNTTVSSISIKDTGITIVASPGSYTIPAQDYLLWSASNDVLAYINGGNIVVNNGVEDLNAKNGLALLLDFEIRTKNVVRVSKDSPANGEFSSIKDANDSITTASASNQFVIEVGPGTYVEPKIVMKPFVSIRGKEMQSVIITPQDPTDHLIVGAAASTVRGCTIKGVTTAGKAGVYSTASGFQLRSCVVRDNPINVLVEGISAIASITADDLIITGSFTTGMQVKNSGAAVVGVFKGSIVNGAGTPSGAKCMIVEGAGTSFIFSSLVASGIATADCLVARNGGTLKALAVEIKGFNRAIWIENVGSAPNVDILAANLDSNTMDFQNDHPTATGAFSGIAVSSKVSNAAPNYLQLMYQDPISGDLNFTRILATRGFATDLTTIVTSASTTQILSTDAHAYVATGSTSGQILKLPDATTLRIGHEYWIINESTVQITVQQFGGSNPVIINTNGSLRYVLRDNSTSAGVWSRTSSYASAFSGGSSPVLASYNGNANTGRYLEIWPGLSSDVDPFVVPNPEALVAIVLGSEASSTGTVGVFRITDLVNPIASISLTAQIEVTNVSLNIPIATNTKLAVRVTSGSINKPRFAFYLSGI